MRLKIEVATDVTDERVGHIRSPSFRRIDDDLFVFREPKRRTSSESFSQAQKRCDSTRARHEEMHLSAQ